MEEKRLDYLRLMARLYPSIPAASTEIINLSALLNLPKGTEHFISDLHGEYAAFLHVLKNGSGSIKRKIDEIFGEQIEAEEKRLLATLIYYPQQKLPLALKTIEDPEAWQRKTLFRLIQICRVVSSKYTRTQVREALPESFAKVIEELLHEQESIGNRQDYYNSIIDTIIAIGRARAFIIALAELIQRLAIARLHILGDVYDRGPGAHIIMDKLLDYHAVDVQWGNHDMLWMGAAAGSEACIANVIRICLRYSNLATLEEGYGISLMPLATFALEAYPDSLGAQFTPKPTEREEFTQNELDLMARMQKAIAVMQLKLEGQIMQRRPEFEMHDRLLLDKIDLQQGTVQIDGRYYALNDTAFPTLDPKRPYQLSDEERAVMERLALSFANCEKLQRHTRFLYSKGGMYLVYNGNLLYHGCILMDEEGGFQGTRLGPGVVSLRRSSVQATGSTTGLAGSTTGLAGSTSGLAGSTSGGLEAQSGERGGFDKLNHQNIAGSTGGLSGSTGGGLEAQSGERGGFDKLNHQNIAGSTSGGPAGLGTKDTMDLFDRVARQAYFATDPRIKQYGLDMMWYLWCGPGSPLYGKDKMATFERYFIDDASTHGESKNAYYDFRDRQETAERILRAFDLDPETAHIINGHVPVRVKRGESPVKAGGRLLVIDGGFSKAYQAQTGIAGYTLIFNSYGFLLASHDPFASVREAIENESDLRSSTEILERNRVRIRVKDTDEGREIGKKIDDLKALLEAYREGLIKEGGDGG